MKMVENRRKYAKIEENGWKYKKLGENIEHVKNLFKILAGMCTSFFSFVKFCYLILCGTYDFFSL